ncbi:MAG: inositol monophosphatase family protein [Actinomycetota bacterium]|nr:inositol monophosphatase family protein [Actinomycetota bacterium]
MNTESLFDLFNEAAVAVRDAVAAIPLERRRDRTGRSGQYALDVVADTAVCAVLEKAPVRIVSEESGLHDRSGSVTVVVDPVDGSTNCARGISYWATSICALDDAGALAALVVNQATGVRTWAIRNEGAFREGAELRASKVTMVEDAVVLLTGTPARTLPWKQFRALGCAALSLCDVAAGGLDGYVDSAAFHAPWDYLGGLLACREAGAVVRSVTGEELVTSAVTARRQIIAAGTSELADALLGAARA